MEDVYVTIDSNEASQNPELTEVAILHENVADYTIKPLETGDFIIDNIAFERKTPSDFASSLQEGRLREQVERMGEEFSSGYLMIAGEMTDFDNLEHSDIPPKSLRGMVASVMARNNIPVVFCSKEEYIVDVAVRIARKHVEDPSMQIQSSRSVVDDVPFEQRVYAQIDGVGSEMSKTLYDNFESLQSLMSASKDELKNIDGIGDKMAKTIKDHFEDSMDNKTKTRTYNV